MVKAPGIALELAQFGLFDMPRSSIRPWAAKPDAEPGPDQQKLVACLLNHHAPRGVFTIMEINDDITPVGSPGGPGFGGFLDKREQPARSLGPGNVTHGLANRSVLQNLGLGTQLTSQSFTAAVAVAVAVAVAAILIIPVLVVYPFIQRHVVRGLLVGSVKG